MTGDQSAAFAFSLFLAALSAFADAPAPGPPPSPIRFEEIGARSGVHFVHLPRKFTGRPKAEVLEMFTDGGAAVAVGDVDGDGDDDLFLTASGLGQRHHLLLNDGHGAFREVTEAAGVGGGNDENSIVSDALFLDYDGDGRRDLVLARFGTPILYHAEAAGADGVPRFRDVSREAGLTTFGNSIAVIAFDADRDGWLDLLFGHYFAPKNLLALGDDTRVLPNDLDQATNGGGLGLWKNVAGPGATRRFVDVTGAAGLGAHTGWSLDLGHADVDGDFDQDLYVAGDYGTDRFFRNRGDGTFADETLATIGVDTRKGMNVDFGDFDRDGVLDLYVTNITDEYMKECNMLWKIAAPGRWIDVSRETGTCDTDWGWAAKFADFDNDGWQDLVVTNGLRSAGTENYIPLLLETILTPNVDFSDLRSYPDIGDRTWSGYQPQRLFRNLGDGSFAEIAAAAGIANRQDGRGLGVADLDGDGRLDVVQTSVRQPSLHYRNVSPGSGHWLELRLVGAGPGRPLEGHASSRDAIGARVVVEAGGGRQIREVDGGNGYASQSSTRLHFGLGDAARVDALEVRWPSGRVERWTASENTSAVAVDALTVLVEGGR